MSTLIAIGIRGFLWSVLLLFGIGLPLGSIVGIGAAIGAFCGILCVGRSVTMAKSWNVPAVPILCVGLVVLFFAFGLFGGIFPFGLIGIAASNVLLGALFGAVLVPACMIINRLLGMNIPEALAAGLVASIPFLDAAGGHFEKPRWFADLVISRGEDPALLLSWVGSALILLSILALLVLPSYGKGNEHNSGLKLGKFLGLLLVVLLAGAMSFVLSTHLPPVPANPVTPPRPPMSFSGTPPPPPPPEPSPIAAVQFSDIPRYSPRLKGFYFRKPDSKSCTNSMPAGERVMQMTIWYLKEGLAPLVMPGESLVMAVPSNFERAKSATWSVTRMPSISTHDDFMIHSDDETEDIVNAVSSLNIKTIAPSVASPGISQFLGLMDQVLAGKQPPPEKGLLGILSKAKVAEKVNASPSLQAVLITDWIGSQGTLDEKTTNATSSLDDFVKRGLKGTSRQFSELAVASLKARGIEARLAEGYFVPVEAQPDDRILITDNEREEWPEVQTPSGVWLTLPVHPMKVSSNEKPSQQEDRKKEIFDAIQKKSVAKHIEIRSEHLRVRGISREKILTQIIVIFVGLSLLFWIFRRFMMPLYGILRTPREDRARALFRTFAMISERKYGVRGFGETWEHYAHSVIGPINPLRAEIFCHVAGLMSFEHAEPLSELSAVKLFLLFLLAGFLPRPLQRQIPTQHPIKVINP